MVNMSAKFDEEAQNGLVCFGYTAYFSTRPTLNLTFDIQNQWGPSSHHG